MSANLQIMPRPAVNQNDVTSIGERLERLRLALGLSQAAMARLVGMTPQAWNNNERGRDRISVDQAIKVAQSTGAELNWIFTGETRYLPHDLAVKIREVEPQRRRLA